MVRKPYLLTVQSLDPRLRRRPIVLSEHGLGDDDPPVWVDAPQVSVVSVVVQGRETDAVSDIRLSGLVAVRDDVSGLQQLRCWQTGNRRTPIIGGQDQLAEFSLMQSDLRIDGAVAAFDGRCCLAHLNRVDQMTSLGAWTGPRTRHA
jgi:hypothetical protein